MAIEERTALCTGHIDVQDALREFRARPADSGALVTDLSMPRMPGLVHARGFDGSAGYYGGDNLRLLFRHTRVALGTVHDSSIR